MSNGIVLFSGGRDSTLAAYLAAQGNPKTKWDLITYDNHNLVGSNKFGGPEKRGAELSESIENITGQEYVPFHHLFRALAVLRTEINIQQYDFSTICLDCRGAMYVQSVLLGDEKGYDKLADGARQSQGYTEQIPGAVEEFSKFLGSNGIQMIAPVYDIDDKDAIIQQLGEAGLKGRNYELQCLWKRNMARLPAEEHIRKYVGEELVPLMYESLDLLRKGAKVPELENLVIENNIRRREKATPL